MTDDKALIARLRRYCRDIGLRSNTMVAAAARLTALLGENEALRAEVERKDAALLHFLGDPVMEGLIWSDVKPTDLMTIRIQKQLYDQARAALSPAGGKGE